MLRKRRRDQLYHRGLYPLRLRDRRETSHHSRTTAQERVLERARCPTFKGRNAQHLPEVPPYPHTDEDLEETSQPTPAISATPAPVGNETSKDLPHVEKVERYCYVHEPSLEHPPTLGNKQNGQNPLRESEPYVETRSARRVVRIRAPREVRREEDEAHLRSMLDRLSILEAIAEAREPIDSNDQLQQRILED